MSCIARDIPMGSYEHEKTGVLPERGQSRIAHSKNIAFDDKDLRGSQARKSCRIEELPIPKSLWSCARDIFWCPIVKEDPIPDDVDKFALECFDQAAVKIGEGISSSLTDEAIHTVCMGPQ